eukprot:SM000064S19797  [mRNA]  locus=s64:538478:539601:+ [translate_table: standard]
MVSPAAAALPLVPPPRRRPCGPCEAALPRADAAAAATAAQASKSRLFKEYKEVQRESTPDSDVRLGPGDTPYAGGVFQLSLAVPEQYPLVPPQARFVTKVFHPNVHFKSVCRAVIALLSHPEPDSPLNCDCGNLLRAGDHRGYRSMAEMYMRLAAMPRS